MNVIEAIEREQLKQDLPDFRVGDTVRVHVKVVEGSNERIQIFEGAVLRRMGSGINEMFTVRKVTQGVGVERTFRCTHHGWQRLMWFAAAKFAVPGCIICGSAPVRLPASRIKDFTRILGSESGHSLSFFAS